MSDKVISLADARAKVDEKKADAAPERGEVDFDAIMEANKKKAEKMAKERLEVNKSVLRSYKIKS